MLNRGPGVSMLLQILLACAARVPGLPRDAVQRVTSPEGYELFQLTRDATIPGVPLGDRVAWVGVELREGWRIERPTSSALRIFLDTPAHLDGVPCTREALVAESGHLRGCYLGESWLAGNGVRCTGGAWLLLDESVGLRRCVAESGVADGWPLRGEVAFGEDGRAERVTLADPRVIAGQTWPAGTRVNLVGGVPSSARAPIATTVAGLPAAAHSDVRFEGEQVVRIEYLDEPIARGGITAEAGWWVELDESGAVRDAGPHPSLESSP